jgi:histone H3/H4
MDATQKAVMKKKKTRFFETYISKVLKQVSSENGITANSKQQLNSALCHISRLVANKVITLTEIAKKKTMSDKEVINAIRIVFPVDLANNAIAHGQKAIETYESVDNTKGVSRQEKAGILFPPAQTEKFLRNFRYSKVMVTNNAPVFLAGSIEYIASLILENAVKSAQTNKRVRITIRDLELGVRCNEEINNLFTQNNLTFLGGGVTPFIHQSLLVKKNRKKRVTKRPAATSENDKKKHRFRPGTVSLREIRRFQKTSNCLTFAKHPFEKYVRDVINKHNENNSMKVSKEVFIILQYFIEQKIVDVLRNANFAAIHANRVKLMPVDINFVQSIISGVKNPYHDEQAEDNIDEEFSDELLEEGGEEDMIEEEEEEEEDELVEEESA